MVDSQAIDATDLVVCVRDRTGRYVLVNAGFEQLTGLPRERIQGKRDAALNPQDIAERVSFHDTQVFDTGAPSEVDEELLGREGRLPVRSCRFAICNDDGEPWAVCSVSGPRGHAESVRAERDRLGAIAAGTPKPHSAVTSERLTTLVADLQTARETAAGLTEALEAERTAREEQAEALARAEQASAAAEAERIAAAAALESERTAIEQERAAMESAQAKLEEERTAREQERTAREHERAELASRIADAEGKRAELAKRLEQREAGHSELAKRLEHERAAAAKLSEKVKALEATAKKASSEGGLLQNVRLRHERAERAKATERAEKEATLRQRFEAQFEAERKGREELKAELERERAARAALEHGSAAADQERAALEQAHADVEQARAELEQGRTELEQERAARAELVAQLEDAGRDIERTRHELEAAREELEVVRKELADATVIVPEPAEAGAAASPQPALSYSSLVVVQRRVTDLISDSHSLEGAMRSGLAAFGELSGWDAAIGWLLPRDGAWLRPASVWCSQAVAGTTFETQTWQAILDDGPQAIAEAWEASESVWLDDAGAEEDRPRCRWARAAGLTNAVAVPVIVDGEKRGMLEVYRREQGAREEDVIAALETVAAQLGGIERLLELADRPRWR